MRIAAFAILLAVAVGVRETAPAETRPAAGSQPALHSRVDRRVELMSIIFRLAGNTEYNMPSSDSPYARDVKKYFEKVKSHPVILKARELHSANGVSFDAVMSMAVHVDGLPGLKELIPFDRPECRLDNRWKPKEARTFLKLARDFIEESKFEDFFREHQAYYDAAAERMDKFLAREDYLAWFDSFFGARANASFEVLIGLLNGGGNYGVSARRADGREVISPVIGVWKFDAEGLPVFPDTVLPTLIHEFCHSYTNPIVEKNLAKMKAAGETLFSSKAEEMRMQAYGEARTVLCESMVRACVVRYLLATRGAAQAKAEISEQRNRGFEWVGELADVLAQYEKARDRYPTFEAFMPKVIEFFDAHAAKIRKQSAG